MEICNEIRGINTIGYYLFKRNRAEKYKMLALFNDRTIDNLSFEFELINFKRTDSIILKLKFDNKFIMDIAFPKNDNGFCIGYGISDNSNDLFIVRMDKSKLFFEFFEIQNFKNYYFLFFQRIVNKDFFRVFTSIRKHKIIYNKVDW